MHVLHRAEGFHHRRAGDAVVKRARGNAAAHFNKVRYIHRNIADLHLCLGLFARRCADVHKQLRHGCILCAMLFGFKIGHAVRAVFKLNLAC